MTLWLERRDRIRAGSNEQNENHSQSHLRADCKAQVKKLPLFCKTTAPVSADRIVAHLPACCLAHVRADAIHTGHQAGCGAVTRRSGAAWRLAERLPIEKWTLRSATCFWRMEDTRHERHSMAAAGPLPKRAVRIEHKEKAPAA